MRIHILGICGTFMGGLALLARELGLEVEGSDSQVYPPMSTQLEAAGITLKEGYDPGHLQPVPDQVVIGNALSRGNPAVEYILDHRLDYVSGPQWLAQTVLRDRHVLAVAGTHGKTTASSILTWILEAAGLEPGFLIGGIPVDFGCSARLGGGRYFVIEADEYDTAFFDKRSKFIHYAPRTLVINNIEFDHADIFRDLEDIKRQFHHLVRIVPASGRLLCRCGDANIEAVLERGCWTPVEFFGVRDGDASGGPDWEASLLTADSGRFSVSRDGQVQGEVSWDMAGAHNVDNALAAIAAAAHAGVEPGSSCAALSRFRGVRRRLEQYASAGGVTLYDDFAHHPTAIRATIAALRNRIGRQRLIAVLEPRSNTMRMGIHSDELADSLAGADLMYLFQPADLDWNLAAATVSLDGRCRVFTDTGTLIEALATMARAGDHILIMSNGGFEELHGRLASRLESA